MIFAGKYESLIVRNGGVIMRRIYFGIVMIFAPCAFFGTAEATDLPGASNLYLVANAGSASFVGKFSSRDKCLAAAMTATKDVIIINSQGNQQQ
jgi:hypothetical protein